MITIVPMNLLQSPFAYPPPLPPVETIRGCASVSDRALFCAATFSRPRFSAVGSDRSLWRANTDDEAC